jgi:hypothetical protein
MEAESDRHGNDDCEHYHAAMGQLQSSTYIPLFSQFQLDFEYGHLLIRNASRPLIASN